MNWWKAIILGIIQGLTEFLPVSSSGHLYLAENLMGISESGNLFFFVMLHVATVAAVLIVLARSVIGLFKWPLPKKTWRLALATLPGIAAGVIVKLFLEEQVEDIFGGSLLWLMFLITAAVLFLTELTAKKAGKALAARAGGASGQGDAAASGTGKIAAAETGADGAACDTSSGDGTAEGAEITTKQALIMGCAQAVAILPGISRSGSTICAGVMLGADRRKVADFSFLMSVIIIAGSALVEVITSLDELHSMNFLYLALGMVSAFLSGFFAIKLMLKLIAKADYKWFSLYLVLLSIVTLVLNLTYFK